MIRLSARELVLLGKAREVAELYWTRVFSRNPNELSAMLDALWWAGAIAVIHFAPEAPSHSILERSIC
jgi:hypothetical protein